ncbi:MAG: beta-galactosidase [Frondihabitans sp.]|nr:beta-galactosidase [Frondihabitans sp.]
MATSYVTETSPGSGRRSPARSWLHSDAPAIDLSGEWAFRLLPHLPGALGLDDVLPQGEQGDDFADPGSDVSDWDRIPVPSHWVLQGNGRWGSPIYTNVQFPFPIDVPNVPDENPTGDYRRDFEVPGDWSEAARHLLRFDGVGSTYRVWLNGVEIGVGAGSRLAQEFDVTGVLRPGTNTVAVRVHQWSAASYIEDQDQWWLPGIFREVTILARPVGALDDVWLRTTWSANRATVDPEIVADAAAFPVRFRIPELGVDETWSGPERVSPVVVTGADPWSAESPRLYDAIVESTGETVTQRLGFRTVRIEGDLLLANDRRLVFHGMNRHEAHPDRGRVFDEEHARADLARMKRFNVNAIRTSHYPPHPRLLDLADELGLWVVLECDLESHGFEAGINPDPDGSPDEPDPTAWTDNPSDDPAWRDVYLDRIERTVERDKNHPSIVLWSLGNESGTGANLAAMAAWVHQRDASRPVHYEGDYTGAYTDVYSRMYASVPETESIGRDDDQSLLMAATAAESARLRRRPFLLCEYVHAMGNGPGAIDQYEALVDRYPRLHGGFVWEWRDHGIRTRADDGTEFFGYGGDFGEVVHDGNFVMDGMILSDDTPTPGLHEYAAVSAPFRFAVDGGEIVVTSYRHSRPSDDVAFVWRLERDGVESASGELSIEPLAPGASQRAALPEIDANSGSESWLTFEAVLRADVAWASAGHVLAFAQHQVSRAFPDGFPRPPRRTNAELPARVELGPATFVNGRLVGLAGADVDGPQLALFRAPTDNDSLDSRGSYDLAGTAVNRGDGVDSPPLADLWRAAGLDRMTSRIERVEATEDGILTVARHAAAASRDSVVTEERWQRSGEDVLLTVSILPSAGWDLVWPRLGIRFDLPIVESASWFGTGPFESYPDSRRAARVGLFESTVDDLNVRYARPQETGHRSDLRSLELRAGGVPWLQIGALADEQGRRPGFALSRHTAEQIAHAHHPHELPPSERTYLYLDASQNGLGSRACGVDVWPEFALRPEARTLRFRISSAGVVS